ncbi:MAG: hypothetical protein Q8S13_14630, partial [Dehalococcoidia bacterium]|nr:hypothetical protein [Dehalococcoidia bacterium]
MRIHPAFAAFAALSLVVLFGSGVEQEKNSWDASQIVSGTLGPARLGTGTPVSTTFLQGDQTWAQPALGTDTTGSY